MRTRLRILGRPGEEAAEVVVAAVGQTRTSSMMAAMCFQTEVSRAMGPGTPAAGQGPDLEILCRNKLSGANGPSEAFKHLEKFHGIAPEVASKRLHKLKKSGGMGGADNVTIGRTGDVYN